MAQKITRNLAEDLTQFLTANLVNVPHGQRADELPRVFAAATSEVFYDMDRTFGDMLWHTEGGWGRTVGDIGEALTWTAMDLAGYYRIELTGNSSTRTYDLHGRTPNGRTARVECKTRGSNQNPGTFSASIAPQQLVTVKDGGPRHFSFIHLDWDGHTLQNVYAALVNAQPVRRLYTGGIDPLKVTFNWNEVDTLGLGLDMKPATFDQIVEDFIVYGN